MRVRCVKVFTSSHKPSMCWHIFLLVYLLGGCVVSLTNVRTRHGPISGASYTLDEREVWEFIGVPYAEPPVDSLRFRRAQPLSRKWETPMKAVKAPKGCMQPPTIDFSNWPEHLRPTYGEDCLYLNVWTPHLKQTNKKSVMVWFHGGAFNSGESLPFYNGRALASIGDVVVVVVQYRVGIMGFARFDDKEVRGNNGLLDQQMALKWVNENIIEFGGDPDSVTIFGESAGAGAVAYHMINKESGKFFNRAIMQSGSIGLNGWSTNPNTKALEALNKNIVAKYLNCDHLSIDDLLKCFEGKTEDNIRQMVVKYATMNPGEPSHGPTVDGHFISSLPTDMIAAGKINKKDLLIGVNELEGALFLNVVLSIMKTAMKIPGPIQNMVTPELVRTLIPQFIPYYPYYPQNLSTTGLEMIVQRSFSHVDPTNAFLNAMRLSESLGQFSIECDVNTFADAVRKAHDNVYFYRMVHQPSMRLLPLLPAEWMKCTHGDDVLFVFGIPLVYPDQVKMSEAELLLSRKMIGDWTHFAKYGKPQDTIWKPFSLEKKGFYKYGLKQNMENGGVNRDNCVFWHKILPMVNSLACKGEESKCGLSNAASESSNVKDEL